MLSAYSNKQTVKDKYIKQFRHHIELDNLIRGDYLIQTNSHWRGCAITCMLNDPKTPVEKVTEDHQAFERRTIRFPEWLGILIDSIHEETSSIEFSQEFQVKLLESIPVGFSDWKTIRIKFLIYVLEDCKIHYPLPVQSAINLLQREINGDPPTETEYSAPRSVARSVAWSASKSATWSAVASAVSSASCSVAWSATWSAVASGTKSATWDRYANYLIDLFQGIK
jgi:hypothetical protein